MDTRHQRILFNTLASAALFWVLQLWYSYAYTHVLSLPITVLALVYLTLSVALFLLLLSIVRPRWGLGIGALVLIGLTGFALANAVYVKIFNQFIPLDVNWLGATQASGEFFLSYWRSIPFAFSVMSVLYLFLSILSLRIFLRTRVICGRAEDSMLEKNHTIDIFMRQRVYAVLIVLLILGLMNHQYLRHPPESWWQARVQAADLGYVGYLSMNVHRSVMQPFQALFADDEFIKKTETVFFEQARSPFAKAIAPIKSELHQLAAIAPDIDTSTMSVENALAGTDGAPHIIFYQLESIASWLYKLDPNPMPFLQSLEQNHLSVDRFMPNGCHTVHAELSSLCGIPPHASDVISETGAEATYRCLPEILKEQWGYENTLYHSNNASFYRRDVLGPKWGFDELLFTEHFRHKSPDRVMIADMLDRMEASTKPTFSHLISFTSHSPHVKKQIALLQNEFGLETPAYEEPLTPDIMARIQQDLPEDIQGYPWFARAVDEALEGLFNELEMRGLKENTIVVIFGDHRYYNFPEQDRLENFFDYNLLPFVIVTPDERLNGNVASYATTADIPATVLHLLEGKDYSPRAEFIGTSLFDPKYPNSNALSCLGYAHYIDEHVLIQGKVIDSLYPITQQFTDLDEKQKAQYQYHFEQYMEQWDAFLERDFLVMSEELGEGMYRE